jgi:hypothetical protein
MPTHPDSCWLFVAARFPLVSVYRQIQKAVSAYPQTLAHPLRVKSMLENVCDEFHLTGVDRMMRTGCSLPRSPVTVPSPTSLFRSGAVWKPAASFIFGAIAPVW